MPRCHRIRHPFPKLFVLFVIWTGQSCFGITDEEIFRNFQFSFVNPGARSSAMGNAFLALADDATAAEANPAGLTILTKPEVSLEYRNVQYDAERLNARNNTITELEIFETTSVNDLNQLNRLSFFSIVFPRGRNTFAFSRQEAVRIKGSIDELFTVDVSNQVGFPLVIEGGALGEVDQTVVNWNFSAARKVGERFTIGASLRLSQLDWQTRVENFKIFENQASDQFQTITDESDFSFGWNAGILYRLDSQVTLGVVYKRNPRFEVTGVEAGPAAQKPGTFNNVLKIPDTFGAGLSVKFGEFLILCSDIVHVQYSDLLEGFEAGYNFLTDIYDNGDLTYGIKDAYEFHAGVEFILIYKDLPIALRQGYYRKPSNSLFVTSVPGQILEDDLIIRAIFQELESENHITIGNGFVFSNFQVDWAFDASKSVDTFILSSVFRF